MTIQERDTAIQAVKNSELYLPLKAERIREIMDEYNSQENQVRPPYRQVKGADGQGEFALQNEMDASRAKLGMSAFYHGRNQ